MGNLNIATRYVRSAGKQLYCFERLHQQLLEHRPLTLLLTQDIQHQYSLQWASKRETGVERPVVPHCVLSRTTS